MRNCKLIRWVFSVSLLVLTASGCGYALAENSNASSKVTLCDVLAHPADYSGKTLTMTVRITGTKEGSFLWSSNCRKLGLSLQIGDEAKSDADIQNLIKMLRLHGLSDHPVVATLTGVFLYNQEDERHRRRSVFRVSAATEIRQEGVKDANPLRNEAAGGPHPDIGAPYLEEMWDSVSGRAQATDREFS